MSWQKSVQLLLATCFFVTGTTIGEAAEIVGLVEVPPQHTVRLSIKDLPAKAGATWRVRPMDGQAVGEIEWVSEKKGPAVRFIGPEGRYEVTCTFGSVDKDGNLDLDYAEAVVTIGRSAPRPDPKPVDPKLDAALQAAYDATADADRATTLPGLAALYRQAAAVLRDKNTRGQVATYDKLWAAVEAVAVTTKVSKKAIPLQQAISRALVDMGNPAVLGKAVIPDQDKLADDFDRVAAALSRIKP